MTAPRSLIVIDKAIDEMSGYDTFYPLNLELGSVRNDFAALIEAAQCVCRTSPDADWEALDAALARCGGAK